MKITIYILIFICIIMSCKTPAPCGGVASIEHIIKENKGIINGDSVRLKY